MLSASYRNLTINKPSGDGTVNGSAESSDNLNLTNGNIVVNGSFTIDVGPPSPASPAISSDR